MSDGFDRDSEIEEKLTESGRDARIRVGYAEALFIVSGEHFRKAVHHAGDSRKKLGSKAPLKP